MPFVLSDANGWVGGASDGKGIVTLFRGQCDFPKGADRFKDLFNLPQGNIDFFADVGDLESYSSEMRKTWVGVVLEERRRVDCFFVSGATKLVRLATVPLVLAGVKVEFVERAEQLPLPPSLKKELDILEKAAADAGFG